MSTPQRRRPASFRRRWTAEEESLLGVKPDRVLARELGRTVEAVKGRRQRRRIRLLRGWTPEEVKLLGTRPDREVAVLVGRAPYAVTGKRIKLGIPRCYDRRHWAPEHLELLGRKPDKEVAILTGHSLSGVESRRWLLGRANPGSLVIRWTPEQDRLLGQRPDREVAPMIGRSLRAVQKRRRMLKIKTFEAALAARELASKIPAALLRQIDEVVGRLPEPDRALVARRFGATDQAPQSVSKIAQQDGVSRALIYYRLDHIVRRVCRQQSLNSRSLLDCVDGISAGSSIPLSPAPVLPGQEPAAGFRYHPQFYVQIVAMLRSAAGPAPAGTPPDRINIPEHLEFKPVAAFRLPARLRHLLQYAGIRLLGDLDGKRLSDFAEYRGCGKNTLRALRHLLLRALHRRTPTRSRAKSP